MNALNGVSGVRTTAMLVVPLHRIGVKNNASFLTKFRNRDVLIVRRDTRTVSTLRTVLYFYRLFIYGLFYVASSSACQYLLATDKSGLENI